ncbi:membrane fusion protein of RND family multidrug efflux pump [alpha proteobacterium U9-1i]|nr:membrane fusion protein of RND family multidrug efflux pump [alpha proteobacterium U9-1i]
MNAVLKPLRPRGANANPSFAPRRIASAAATFAISASLLALAACGNPGASAQNGQMPPPEVGVVEIAAQSYEHTIRLPGRVSAFEVSEVRPQIGGIVRARNFREGATVRAGQVLYEIDAGPARADLAAADAAAASARARFERYQSLIDINAISRQEFDDARAAADQATAAANSARISVGYSRVTAPIGGIIGASSVTPGALATPSQPEPFAVIQQIDRVYVDMTRSSSELLALRDRSGLAGGRASVRLIMPDGSYHPVTGELQFSDVTVNESTGTVTLRALFRNPNHTLLPGMFVNAEVSQGVQENAILAPQQGVTRNARGEATALIVNAEGMVEQRVLETGPTAGDRWVVLSGLNPGDKLIVEGTQRVQPGAPATAVPVTPTEQTSIELRGRQNG